MKIYIIIGQTWDNFEIISIHQNEEIAKNKLAYFEREVEKIHMAGENFEGPYIYAGYSMITRNLED